MLDYVIFDFDGTFVLFHHIFFKLFDSPVCLGDTRTDNKGFLQGYMSHDSFPEKDLERCNNLIDRLTYILAF